MKKGMKKGMILLLLLLLCATVPAAAEYWPHDSSHAVVCAQNRPGCLVLQMVMMGCFDYAETPDSLDERVLSAVLPKLCAVEEGEFAHFCEEFSVEADVIQAHYYKALANCLLSDIHLNPNPGGDETLVRRVLRLYLEPESEADSEQQMESIRMEMTDELSERMAKKLSIPKGFVDSLIGSSVQPTAEE